MGKLDIKLNEEQVEALWPIVPASAIVSALYSAGDIKNVYSAIAADDVRNLLIIILQQFEDDDQEATSQIEEAIASQYNTVSAVLRFRVREGYFSSFEFLFPILGEEIMSRLIVKAAQNAQ